MNPSSSEILAFQVSDRAQSRLERLLALNRAGLLSEAELMELDEMEKIDHTIVMLKAQVAKNSLTVSESHR